MSICRQFLRAFSSRTQSIKVAIFGASGSIGTNMSLLLKMNPLINEVLLVDTAPNVHGIALDLSQVSTPCRVSSFHLNEHEHQGLQKALSGCSIVMIAAGRRRRAGMDLVELFNANAKIVESITLAILGGCPKAFVGIITNPVNALVPLVNEIIAREGKGDWKRVFGVTTIDVIRAKTIIGEAKNVNPMVIDIPVIGGHSAKTTVPLISRSTPVTNYTAEEIEMLTARIRNVGDDILKMKGNAGATISTAYASARITSSMVRAILGETNIVECAFVKNDALSTKYLCSPVVINQDGVKDYYKIDVLTEFEEQLFQLALHDLTMFVKLGESFLK